MILREFQARKPSFLGRHLRDVPRAGILREDRQRLLQLGIRVLRTSHFEGLDTHLKQASNGTRVALMRRKKEQRQAQELASNSSKGHAPITSIPLFHRYIPIVIAYIRHYSTYIAYGAYSLYPLFAHV